MGQGGLHVQGQGGLDLLHGGEHRDEEHGNGRHKQVYITIIIIIVFMVIIICTHFIIIMVIRGRSYITISRNRGASRFIAVLHRGGVSSNFQNIIKHLIKIRHHQNHQNAPSPK